MAEYHVRVSQVVYYDAVVQAEDASAAKAKVQSLIDNDEDWGFCEVDNGPFEIESEEARHA